MPNVTISDLPTVAASGSSFVPVSDAAGTTTSKVAISGIVSLATASPSVVEAASSLAFPATGASATLYIASDVGKLFRWTGSVYVEIGPS
jgi:hypothetical protein